MAKATRRQCSCVAYDFFGVTPTSGNAQRRVMSRTTSAVLAERLFAILFCSVVERNRKLRADDMHECNLFHVL